MLRIIRHTTVLTFNSTTSYNWLKIRILSTQYRLPELMPLLSSENPKQITVVVIIKSKTPDCLNVLIGNGSAGSLLYFVN